MNERIEIGKAQLRRLAEIADATAERLLDYAATDEQVSNAEATKALVDHWLKVTA